MASGASKYSTSTRTEGDEFEDDTEDEELLASSKKPLTLDENALNIHELLTRLSTAQKFTPVQLKKDELEVLCDKVRKLMLDRPMLLELTAPMTVFGDLHGQYYDMLHIFNHLKKWPSADKQLLCLGDYVDRGIFGLETMTLLFLLKLKYPDSVHLLRGNHESAAVSRVYGFYEECKKRIDVSIWKRFCEVFDCMPVAAIINKAILCMHGGLSPHLKTLDDIRKLPRPTEIPPGGLLTDLLWSDPDPKLESGFGENPRGVSFVFSSKIAHEFCRKFKLDLVMRAHQVVFLGYELFADNKVMTVFTAPNFCGQFENMGAVTDVDKDLTISMLFLAAGKKSGKKGKGGPPKEPYPMDKWPVGKKKAPPARKLPPRKKPDAGDDKKKTYRGPTRKYVHNLFILYWS